MWPYATGYSFWHTPLPPRSSFSLSLSLMHTYLHARNSLPLTSSRTLFIRCHSRVFYPVFPFLPFIRLQILAKHRRRPKGEKSQPKHFVAQTKLSPSTPLNLLFPTRTHTHLNIHTISRYFTLVSLSFFLSFTQILFSRFSHFLFSLLFSIDQGIKNHFYSSEEK